jgi:hypothetical protein
MNNFSQNCFYFFIVSLNIFKYMREQKKWLYNFKYKIINYLIYFYKNILYLN